MNGGLLPELLQRRILIYGRVQHQWRDGRCEWPWNLFVLLANLLVVGVWLTGWTGHWWLSFGYLVIVPGMSILVWLRPSHQSLLSAEALMLVVPLSFAVNVIASLIMVYFAAWSPWILASATVVASSMSAWLRIRRIICWPCGSDGSP